MTNHEFVDTYLAGYKNRIRNQMVNRIARLKFPEKHFDCQEPDEVLRVYQQLLRWEQDGNNSW